jgi:spore coat polysaccharide biosynthesis protein SpsF
MKVNTYVTPYMYLHPSEFNLKNVEYESDESHYRWTVDTIEDFLLIEKIVTHIPQQNIDYSLEDLLLLLRKFPEWSTINAHIEQKKLGE